ncbi:hypothetical protein RJ640_012677 [Escallonia rubra]|uniref:Uncharacterized protein n=1 Tax=Escallonia rubra TaxID=112253 RepID=A0AA88S2F9_9ASTE|nr:hypothetical protein RJ640_012677 [Escallonia rubra]
MSSPKPSQLAANNFTASDFVLVGSLPTSIGNLTKLRTLSIPHHLLSGEIPAAIKDLALCKSWNSNVIISPAPFPAVKVFLIPSPAQFVVQCIFGTDPFEAEANQIVGSIPPEIGSLKKLKCPELSKNKLSGSLLDQLGELKELKCILLGENNLTGSIPAKFSQLTSLVVLDLSQNDLTGHIPATLVNDASLEILLLNHNRLSGEIPSSFSNLSVNSQEPIVDYINKWRALSLDRKERIYEASAVEMCMQGMHWGLLYILQGNKPCTFEELATRGHNMEIAIVSHGGNNPPNCDSHEETKKVKWTWGSKVTTEDSMVVTETPLNISNKHKNEKKDKKKNQPQGRERQQPKFKELEHKVYPFSDSEVPGILDSLLKHKLIDLPKLKRAEEARQVNEPKYYKYHRLISHPTGKCFTLKEVIMDLSRKGKIHLDDEEVEESNNTSIIFRAVVSSASYHRQENRSPKAFILGASKA